MTDLHTQQALDLLAELYLTPSPPGAATRDPSPIPIESYRGTRFDRSTAAASPRQDDRPACTLRAVLLGHLPGYASPWISQYAHHAAMHEGGALLVRVQDGSVDLELFDGDRVDRPARSVGRAGGAASLRDTLEGALADVGTVAVVMPEPAAGTAGLTLRDLPRWTLLSGTDDAAVVGAYRLLKGLVGNDGTPAPPLGIGVMFMGAGSDEAERALERLNKTAGTFMRLPIELDGTRERMEPVRRRSLGHFDIAAGSDDWLACLALLSELAQAEPAGDEDDRDGSARLTDEELAALSGDADPSAAAPPPGPASRPVPQAPEPRVMPSIDRVEPVANTPAAAEPDRVGMERDTVVPLPPPERPKATSQPIAASVAGAGTDADAAVVRDREAAPRPVIEAVGLAASAGGPDDLVAYLGGAVGTEARCPRHPDAQLAVDVEGRLHLLGYADGPAVMATVQSLMEVKAWAREHRLLLAMACHDRRCSADLEPVIHLFTNEPRPALSLATSGLPDQPPLVLHLLKRVCIADQTVHVHQRLN